MKRGRPPKNKTEAVKSMNKPVEKLMDTSTIKAQAIDANAIKAEKPVDFPSEKPPEQRDFSNEVQSETAPWNANENPWSVDKVRIKKNRIGFRHKLVSPKKLETRLYEGWVIADGKNYGEPSGPVNRNELVLMEMPESKARQRDEHFSNLTKERSRAAQKVQLSQDIKNMSDLQEM